MKQEVKYKLSDIAEVSAGQPAPQKISAFTDAGCPFVRAGSLQTLIANQAENKCELINNANALLYKMRLFPKDTVIFAKSGMSAKIGRVYRLKSPCYLVSHLAAIIPGNNIDAKYLQRWLEINPPSRLIPNDAYPSIRISAISNLEIPLPPLAEQKRIAGILDKADEIRKKRQQAIKECDEFLKATFLDMFGNLTNPNWKKVSFGDTTFIDAPMVDPREEKYLDMIHIGPDRISKNTGIILPALTAREEKLISKKFLFDKRYVLYSKIRPNLKKVGLPNFSGLCSADMYPVRPDELKLTREFLWKLLLSDIFTRYTETLPDRANIPKLNRKEFANFHFNIPPFPLQEKFARIVEKTEAMKARMQESAAELDNNFNNLMQRSFKGEL